MLNENNLNKNQEKKTVIKEIPINFDEKSLLNFSFTNEDTFEHTFDISGIPALTVSGFYEKEEKDLYISKIKKNPELKISGLANQAILVILEKAKNKYNFPLEKVTTDASEAFVKSLEKSIFKELSLMSNQEFSESKEINITIDCSKLKITKSENKIILYL